jgi:hypothetical protein
MLCGTEGDALELNPYNPVSNRDIKITNGPFENVPQFKYLGTTVANQNLIQEESKRRLISGNVCYHLVQNLLSSRLLSKNLKIRICKANNFTCGCVWV